MAKIKCRAVDCIFWDIGFCSADKITYDPEEGCLTYEIIDDLLGEEWDDDLDDPDDDDDDLNYLYDDDDLDDDLDGNDW